MSRLTLKYFDIFIAAAKLSGVANSFGSVRFEWLCMPTTILCLSANGATRFATSSVVDAVMIVGAERLGDLEPAIDLRVGEARVHVVVVGVDGDAGGVELLPHALK